jgi:hypothetical protein
MNCPACGVAVLPGYARCPRCRKPLPQRPANTVEGGTALEPARRIPLPAVIAAGAVGLAVILWLGLRGGDDTAPARPQPVATTPAAAPPPPRPTATPTPAVAPPPPSAPSADEVADDLERTLKRQRLWSTVSVTGSRVDIRGGACSDPAIQAPIAATAAAFKAAGLTTLRCVEQSGAVVFTREL